MSKPAKKTKSVSSAVSHDYSGLVSDVSELLEAARRASVRTVNAFMTASYWEVGRRIVQFEQGGEKRAEYGEALLERLSQDLTAKFGRGFVRPNLIRFRQFYQAFPNPEIGATASNESSAPVQICSTVSNELTVASISQTPSRKMQTPSAQFSLADLARAFPLPWSHYVLLISRSRSAEAFAFYHTEALRGGWSVRQLARQIDSQFYERTALSRNKAAMLARGAKPQPGDVVSADEEIRHPLVLEFLGLRDEYSETDLEAALIQHLETFLLELGNDFAFIGRQRRLRIDDDWYRVDLLFFHRRLRCLVIFDLKLGRFTHADAGQIYPVIYEHFPLRLRVTKPVRRQFLRGLHQRPSSANRATQRWSCSIHRKSSPARSSLLRGVPRSGRRDQARKVSQDCMGQALHQIAPQGLSHGVNVYLNYAREHWSQPGENPPVGVILCSGKGEALVRYATEALPTKMLVREYLTALPDEKVLATELEKTRKQLESRK